jgi:Receptor family ligand binding region
MFYFVFRTQVIRLLNWTYVSLVHSADAYGDGAAADIQDLLRLNRDVCLAVIVRIPSKATEDDYNDVVDKLAADTQARVVWSYISLVDIEGFFGAVRRRVGLGRLLFIGGDALNSMENQDVVDVLEGSVYTDLPSAPVSGLQQYVWSLTYGQVLSSVSLVVRMFNLIKWYRCVVSHAFFITRKPFNRVNFVPYEEMNAHRINIGINRDFQFCDRTNFKVKLS